MAGSGTMEINKTQVLPLKELTIHQRKQISIIWIIEIIAKLPKRVLGMCGLDS